MLLGDMRREVTVNWQLHNVHKQFGNKEEVKHSVIGFPFSHNLKHHSSTERLSFASKRKY